MQARRNRSHSAFNPVYAIVGFAFFWTLVLLLLDGVMLPGVWKQHDAAKRFVRTDGTILDRDMQSGRLDESRLVIRFEYEAGGIRRQSGDWSFDDSFTNREEMERELYNRWTPGKVVPAYFDPDDPATAILKVGILPKQWFCLMLLLSFHAFGAAMWCLAISLHWQHGRANWFLKRDDGQRARFVTRNVPSLALGFLVCGFLAFIALFPIGASASGFSDAGPTKVAMTAAVAIGTASFVLVFLWKLLGLGDFVIDSARRTVRKPIYPWGRRTRTFGFENVRSIEVLRDRQGAKHSSANEGSPQYSVRMNLDVPARSKPVWIASHLSQGAAYELGRWLNGKMNVPLSLPAEETRSAA